MPIGESLAQARQRAGLTVAQVSEQTCIREAVIEGIEGGDYSACGGDFYARANIRSIAKVVGADSGPLIAEYDALHRAGGALSAVSLEELLAMSASATQRRRPEWPAPGGLMASGHAPAPRRADSQVAGGPEPAYRPRGRWVGWILVLGLVGVVGFGVYSRFSGPRQAAAAPPAAGRHAATHQQAGSGGLGPAPKPTHVSVAPAPAPTITHAAMATAPAAAPAQTLTPASAGAPGPDSGNATPAQRATEGNPIAGQAPQPARDRPLPEPAKMQKPASEQDRPSGDHDRRYHHRRRAPAVQQGAELPGQQVQGERYNVGPEVHA